jgi:hypothetical protein
LWDRFVNWLNEPWHGGKAGETIIPGYTVEQYKKDLVNNPDIEKIELASMLVPIPGAAFGKLGKVVTNPGLRITSMSTHAMNQAITRGVTSPTILSIVRSPLVVLQQGSGNYLYLSRSGAVVLSPEGKMVTTYSAQFFDDTIKGIVGWFK